MPDDVLGVYVGVGPRADAGDGGQRCLGRRPHLANGPRRGHRSTAPPRQHAGPAARIAATSSRDISTTADLAVSNVGTVDLPTGFRTFTWREYAGVLPATLTAGDLMVSGGTLDGRFPIVFDYSTRFLSDDMATRIADRSIEILVDAATAG